MPTAQYAEELAAEGDYIAQLYARLDAERDRVKTAYQNALRTHESELVDREVQARTLARQARALDVADHGLCFGRLDRSPDSGPDAEDTYYIGRIGVLDDDLEPLLLDWRADQARAFYTATPVHPEGMRRRRQFHSRGRKLTGFTDELLVQPDARVPDEPDGSSVGTRTDAALLAAVNAPRGGRMRDIVATIQAAQDEVIRLDHMGVTVIEGGPGTGKTAVALHRVAYLLYTQRKRLKSHGVLVVGPNPGFLRHVDRVLPALGESEVVFATTGTLLPGVRATATDLPEVAAHKGSLAMLEVLTAAVAAHQRIPGETIWIGVRGTRGRIDAELAAWARTEARKDGRPHNQARSEFVSAITWIMTERAITQLGKGWLTRDDTATWEQLRAELTEELLHEPAFVAAIDPLWPILTPDGLLSWLYREGPDSALLRADADAWTVSDVPLLDELAELLGPEQPADDTSEREHQAAAKFAADVLDSLVSRADSMDDEDHLYATDLLYAEDLAGHFAELDTRDTAERAVADREWTYGHIVVDEAQELSAMDWRVLMRRCPSKSFTVVGDLTQRRSAAGARTWHEVLQPYVRDRWVYRSLSVNYRTPAEIMSVAANVLASYAPDVVPPESVRSSGIPPWSEQVLPGQIQAAIAAFIDAESGRDGTCAVIGPIGHPGTVPASATKGLEFDAVLVVEPARILAEDPRGAADLYVALTRATQRLGVVHSEQLPAALSGLVQNGRSTD